MLTAELASAFARVALANVEREYPRRARPAADRPGREWQPRKLHPAFYGSYDWHSAVHMHWLLARVLRLHPALPEAEASSALLDEHLSAEAIEAGARLLQRPGGRTFERPYGWAWLLKLQAELRGLGPLAPGGGAARRGDRQALHEVRAGLALSGARRHARQYRVCLRPRARLRRRPPRIRC